MADDSSF